MDFAGFNWQDKSLDNTGKPRLNAAALEAFEAGIIEGITKAEAAQAAAAAAAAPEAIRVLGGAGNPAFAANWRRLANDGTYDVSFYRHNKRVYLAGLAERITNPLVLPSTIFTLPAGYWPPQTQYLTVTASSSGIYRLIVDSGTGAVYIDTLLMGAGMSVGSHLLLSTVSWRHA